RYHYHLHSFPTRRSSDLLHHAALCGEPIVAALLLDAGVAVDAVNREGMTALGIACANGNWGLAIFLLDRGAACEVDSAQPALLLDRKSTRLNSSHVKISY